MVSESAERDQSALWISAGGAGLGALIYVYLLLTATPATVYGATLGLVPLATFLTAFGVIAWVRRRLAAASPQPATPALGIIVVGRKAIYSIVGASLAISLILSVATWYRFLNVIVWMMSIGLFTPIWLHDLRKLDRAYRDKDLQGNTGGR